MNYGKLLLLILSICISAITLPAQDLHFTMFEMTPTLINPAQSGAFYGTFRGGILYRSQWESTTAINGFQTINAYVDAPILSVGKKKRDWLGVGMTFINDAVEGEAGGLRSQGLITNFFIPSGAYHKVLDKKGDHVLTFGIQGGFVTRSLGKDALRFEDEIGEEFGGGDLGVGNSRDLQNIRGGNNNNNMGEEIGSIRFTDFTAGFLYKGKPNDDTKIEIGFALPHIVSINNYNLFRRSSGADSISIDNKRPRTFRVHGKVDYNFNENVSIQPMFLFQTTRGLYEFVLQSTAGYKFNKDLRLRAGLGLRVVNTQGTDALQAMVLAEYKSWLFGISRDFTISELNTVGRIGNAFEVSAAKIFTIYVEPQANPKILCPDF